MAQQMVQNLPVSVKAPKSLQMITPDSASLGTELGVQKYTRREIRPSSNQSNSLLPLSFPVNPTSKTVSRFIRLRHRMTVRLQLDEDVADGNDAWAYLQSRFGMNSLPTFKMLQGGVLTINGQPFTVKVYEWAEPTEVMNSEDTLSTISPVGRPDTVGDYLEVSDSLKNPLAWGQDVGYSAGDSFSYRGAFGNALRTVSVNFAMIGNPAVEDRGKIDWTFDLQEALPLKGSDVDVNAKYFTNVRSLQVDLDYHVNALQRLCKASFTKNNGNLNKITGQSIVGETNTTLLVDEVEFQSGYAPPVRCMYNMPIIKFQSQAPVKVPKSASEKSLTSFDYQLSRENGIPSAIMVCARLVGCDDNPNWANRTLPIRRIGFSLNGSAEELGAVDNPHELYRISRKNGYALPPSSFYGSSIDGSDTNRATGCYMILKPSDVATLAGVQSNVNTGFNLKVNLQCYNPYNKYADDPNEDYYEIKVWMFYDSVLVNDNGVYTEAGALIEPSKVLAELAKRGDPESGSRGFQPVFEDLDNYANVMGGKGRFWSKIGRAFKHGWHKVKDWVKSDQAKNIAKQIRNAGPIKNFVGDGSALGKVASHYGYGNSGGQVNKVGGKLYQEGGQAMKTDDLEALLSTS